MVVYLWATQCTLTRSGPTSTLPKGKRARPASTLPQEGTSRLQ